MASSHSSTGSFSKMSLSEREMQLPPWDQMLHNGALDPSLVTKSDSKISSTISELETEDNFSDGDISDHEELSENGVVRAHKTPILELREYQKELAENALRGDNTIICAPTGSGKTRVATYIILEHFKRSESKGPKIAFLAKTVPLAVQQYKSLCKYLPSHEITLLTGDSGETMSLHVLLMYSDIIVMTPQILENHLLKDLLPNIGVFTMIVFDECHHTRKKDPYQVLMTSYLKLKDKNRIAKQQGEKVSCKLPQIVGLTATIGVDRAVTPEDAATNILKVCGSLDVANLSTVRRNKDELAKYVPVPDEVLIQLRERDDDESALQIDKIMMKLENQLKHHEKELNDANFHVKLLKDLPVNRKDQTYEQWAVKAKREATEIAIHDRGRETNIHVRLSIIILEYLIAYRAALETYDLVELVDVIGYLDKCFHEFKHETGTTGENRFYTNFQELKRLVLSRHGDENQNLRILTKVLIKYLIKKGETSRGIIFVRTRTLAVALSTWLNRCEISAVRKLNACYFTGSNVSEEKGGTSQAHQEAIIHRFRSGEIRLLVATSVAEEGLDIPECNLVIKYNHVGTEVTTVQTRGRSRAFGGVSVLLAMGKILQRERMNRHRVELMKQAIENIQDMDKAQFNQAIEEHQRQLLQDAYIADLLNKTRKAQYEYVPFRMVCGWCRQVAVDGTNVKVVAGSLRVSTDRNLLDHIEVIPDMNPKEIGDSLQVGTAKCKGEPEPGRRCNRKLGRVIKHKQIPYVTLDVKCFAFDLGDQSSLQVYKKWKEVEFAVDELSFEDIKRYLKDDRVLPNSVQEKENDSIADEESDDDEEDDEFRNLNDDIVLPNLVLEKENDSKVDDGVRYLNDDRVLPNSVPGIENDSKEEDDEFKYLNDDRVLPNSVPGIENDSKEEDDEFKYLNDDRVLPNSVPGIENDSKEEDDEFKYLNDDRVLPNFVPGIENDSNEEDDNIHHNTIPKTLYGSVLQNIL